MTGYGCIFIRLEKVMYKPSDVKLTTAVRNKISGIIVPYKYNSHVLQITNLS